MRQHTIAPALADEGRYIASKSTAPNQVWSWDITWLQSLTAGHGFYLYLIEDVFSRNIVGYKVHLIESGDNAAELLVLNADNGAPMKSPVL